MKVGVADFKPVMRDGDLRLMGEGRSTHTLHQSEVLAHIERCLYGERVYGDNDAFAQMGFMWERMVGKALAEYCGVDIEGLLNIGEVEVDGIVITLDRFHAVEGRPYEFKGTWFSMRHVVLPDGTVNMAGLMDRHWKWVMQLMSQCRAMGAVEGCLVPFWVNGDYSRKPPMGGPQFRKIDFEFTPEELEGNWQVMLQNAEDLRRVRASANR